LISIGLFFVTPYSTEAKIVQLTIQLIPRLTEPTLVTGVLVETERSRLKPCLLISTSSWCPMLQPDICIQRRCPTRATAVGCA